MEILFIIFVICSLAFHVVIFIEIEKVVDNTLSTGVAIQRLNKRLFRKGKR